MKFRVNLSDLDKLHFRIVNEHLDGTSRVSISMLFCSMKYLFDSDLIDLTDILSKLRNNRFKLKEASK